MKFALLGWKPSVVPLLRTIAAETDDSLIAAAEVPDQNAAELLTAASGTRILSGWESLLAELTSDACLVAGSSEAVLEGARQLANDGRPLILLPEAGQGTAFVYELTLNQDDNGTPLIPLPHLPLHDLAQRLRQTIKGGELGSIVLFRLERSLPAQAGSGVTAGRVPSLTVPQIDSALFVDVALLRFLSGDYSRVTAVRSTGASDDGISLATVTLGGDGLAEATWSARVGEPAWTLEITGSRGSATLSFEPDLQAGILVLQTGDDEATRQEIKSDGLGLGNAQRAAIQQPMEQQRAAWAEMTRSMETVEATHTSIRKRRTIDLFFETTSERSIFKSQMTAVGCGLVLLTLFMLVAFLVLGAMLDSRSIVQRNAEADGRVLSVDEFLPESPELNAAGEKHLRELSRRMARSPEPVFVLPDDEAVTENLDAARIGTVVEHFVAAGQPESALFVEAASIPHPATLLLLTVLKYLWIAPLVLFLALQSLIRLARPSTARQVDESAEPGK
ncbi:hypothetical protein GC176_10540 [bacterium]|nr:hypothetical protein [bacterium]